MPTYISLVNLTEQGIKEVKNAPERLQSFDNAAREAGGKLVGFYLVMGQYDYVVITEAPDDQTSWTSVAQRGPLGSRLCGGPPHLIAARRPCVHARGGSAASLCVVS